MPESIFCKFPLKYNIEEIQLRKLPDIEDLDNFIKLANKYRNIFRNNFINSAYVPYEDSKKFFKSLNYDDSRILYAISINKTWIGHFGARHLDDESILLDNAMRFSNIGGKDLFKKINLSIINLIRKNLPFFKILIIVDRANISALKLHEELDYVECSKKIYKKMSIDSSKYIVKTLTKQDNLKFKI
jgi:hypothetical protein